MNEGFITYFKKKEQRLKVKRKRDYVYSVLWVVNHVFLVSLLFSYLASVISPSKLWFPAFFGLSYPVLVIINILFAIVWLPLIPKRAIYSLVVLLVGTPLFLKYFQFGSSSNGQTVPNTDEIKVMSFNVKNFDLYNWNHNVKSRNNFFDLIKNESPDIICLQEFYTNDEDGPYRLDNLDTLVQLQKAKNVHVSYTNEINKNHWGGAIFTTYPMVNKGNIIINDSRILLMFCDIIINGDTVRVYNVHLQSIQFKRGDYKFLDDIKNNKETEELKHSKNIFNRLKIAYVKRAEQADILFEHITSSPYPVILCGDFNDTPASYTYTTISQNLQDAFVESGSGFGRTYAGKFPSFRIDYILHSDKYKANNFYVIEKPLSDHYPICCYLEKKKN